MERVFYSFAGMPGNWISSNDRHYPESYFLDKKYDQYIFHDFFEMDRTIGLENTVFGTRGLPIGHPKRTSKSFDTYNKMYGPAIVRIVDVSENQDSKLSESIERVKVLMGVNLIMENSNFNAEVWFKRRANRETLTPFITNQFNSPITCELHDNAESFATDIIMDGVVSFMTLEEELMEAPKYDVYQDIIFDMCYKWFSEELIDYYNQKCK